MAQILAKKERVLEAILDTTVNSDPVHAEALAELELLYEFQASYFAEFEPATEDATARRAWPNGTSAATDATATLPKGTHK